MDTPQVEWNGRPSLLGDATTQNLMFNKHSGMLELGCCQLLMSIQGSQ